MVNLIFFIFVLYILSVGLGYFAHKSFHKKWMGPIQKAHWVHHTIKYPANDLVSTTYRHAGKNSTILLFLPLVISSLLSMFGLYYLEIITLQFAVIGGLEVLLISYLHNALHDAFHLTDSIWHKMPGFKRMQNLHFIHHVEVEMNFGIFDFTPDKVMNTYKE